MEQPEVPLAEVRHSGTHPDHRTGALDQALGGEDAQVEGLAQRPARVRRRDQPQQVGDRSWPDDSGPIATDGRVLGRMARCRRFEGDGPDQAAGDGGRADGRRGARGWRGFHLDGRTGILTEEPGHRDGHG